MLHLLQHLLALEYIPFAPRSGVSDIDTVASGTCAAGCRRGSNSTAILITVQVFASSTLYPALHALFFNVEKAPGI